MSFDPEAEQEVDFGRYWRLIVSRWWLVALGFVVGALVGYAISLGGSQQFKATTTLYLGQPYSASGNVQRSGRRILCGPYYAYMRVYRAARHGCNESLSRIAGEGARRRSRAR